MANEPTTVRDIPIVPCVAAMLAVAAWCLPNHYVPWRSFHGELAMGVAFILAGLWASWRNRGVAPEAPVLAVVAAAACLIPMAQLVAGIIVFAGDFWIVALYLLGFGLALSIGHELAKTEGLEKVLGFYAWTVLAAGLVCVWLALYQWQELDYLWVFAESAPPGGRYVANLGQANHLATLLVLGLCGTAWLHDRDRLGGGVALLLAAFLGLGVAMTQSRTGWLSITLVSAWLIWRRRDLGPRLQPRRVLAAYVVLMGSALIWAWLPSPVEMVAGRDLATVASPGLRLQHWAVMLDAVGRHPWFGYGWNQASAAQAAAAPDHPATGEILEHSHNLLLDLLVWNGVPLGGLLIAALLWWWWRALRGARRPAAIVGVGAVMPFFVHAMLEFPLEYSYFMLPAGLLMGAVTAGAAPTSVLRLPLSVRPLLSGVAVVLTALIATDYLALEDDLRVIRFEEAHIGVDRPRPPPAKVMLLTQLSAFQQFARDRHRPGMTSDELEAMRRVVTRYPYSYALLRYAAALALNNQPEAARAALQPICKTHPAEACASARRIWASLGAADVAIAAVAWTNAP